MFQGFTYPTQLRMVRPGNVIRFTYHHQLTYRLCPGGKNYLCKVHSVHDACQHTRFLVIGLCADGILRLFWAEGIGHVRKLGWLARVILYLRGVIFCYDGLSVTGLNDNVESNKP